MCMFPICLRSSLQAVTAIEEFCEVSMPDCAFLSILARIERDIHKLSHQNVSDVCFVWQIATDMQRQQ